MKQREWAFAGVVAAMIVGVIWAWVAPINVEVHTTEEVIICEPLVGAFPTGVDPLPLGNVFYRWSDEHNIEDPEAFVARGEAALTAACEVQRGNRSTAVLLAATAATAFTVGGIVVLRGHRGPSESTLSARDEESDD